MDKVFTLTAGRMVRIIIVVAALLLTAVRGWGKDNFVMSGPVGWSGQGCVADRIHLF